MLSQNCLFPLCIEVLVYLLHYVTIGSQAWGKCTSIKESSGEPVYSLCGPDNKEKTCTGTAATLLGDHIASLILEYM